MVIIPADEARIDEILALDRQCISPPWTEGQMLSELYNEYSRFELALRDERLLGFYVLRITGDEAELLRIAVAPAERRQGIGGALLAAAVERAKKAGAEKIFLEVRASNKPAISIYERLGFLYVGTRRAYYEKPVEDANVMILEV